MEVTFKFKIGQFVYLRQEVRQWRAIFAGVSDESSSRTYQSMGDLAKKERMPHGMQVLERHFQECYGGIQLHYHLRAGSAVFTISEPELTSDLASAVEDNSAVAAVPE